LDEELVNDRAELHMDDKKTQAHSRLAFGCLYSMQPYDKFMKNFIVSELGAFRASSRRAVTAPACFLAYVDTMNRYTCWNGGHNGRFTACMDSFLPHWRAVPGEMRAGSACYAS